MSLSLFVSVCLSVCLCIYLSTHLPTKPSIHPYTPASLHRPVIDLFLHPVIHPLHLFSHPSIHPLSLSFLRFTFKPEESLQHTEKILAIFASCMQLFSRRSQWPPFRQLLFRRTRRPRAPACLICTIMEDRRLYTHTDTCQSG